MGKDVVYKYAVTVLVPVLTSTKGGVGLERVFIKRPDYYTGIRMEELSGFKATAKRPSKSDPNFTDFKCGDGTVVSVRTKYARVKEI